MRKVREELRTGFVTGHVRTEGGHEGSLPPELTYTNVNAHRHLIQHLITPGSSIFQGEELRGGAKGAAE